MLTVLLALVGLVNGCARLQPDPAGGIASEKLSTKELSTVPGTVPPAGARAGAAEQNRLIAVGQAAPTFDLKQLGGGRLASAKLRGDVILLSFWEPSCPPCHIEAPHLEGLHRKYQKAGVRVIGITPLASLEAIRAFQKKHNLTYSILVDPGEKVTGRFGLVGYPATFLIDRHGTVRFNHSGFGPGDEERLEQKLASLLALRKEK